MKWFVLLYFFSFHSNEETKLIFCKKIHLKLSFYFLCILGLNCCSIWLNANLLIKKEKIFLKFNEWCIIIAYSLSYILFLMTFDTVCVLLTIFKLKEGKYALIFFIIDGAFEASVQQKSFCSSKAAECIESFKN